MTACGIGSGESLQSKVFEAANCLNSYWPIDTFIACNALKGFEDMPFEDSMEQSRQLFNSRGFLELSEYRIMFETGRIKPADFEEAFARFANRDQLSSQDKLATLHSIRTWSELIDQCHHKELVASINQQMTKWCGAYFDQTQAQWSMPRQGGLYESWKRLVCCDFTLSIRGCKNWKKMLHELPSDSSVALANLLSLVGVKEEDTVAYLRRHLVQLPGWASHLKWRQNQPGYENIVIDYLAIRLFYELQFALATIARLGSSNQNTWAQLRQSSDKNAEIDHPLQDHGAVWQEAYELNYRNQLLESLSTQKKQELSLGQTPLSQLVFCIDVRSELMRRHLESLGAYSTYGFAGFFGFAMRFKALGSALSLDLCPVLLNAQKEVQELGVGNQAERLLRAQALGAAALQLRKRLKSSLVGAFGLVETLGLWSVIPLVGRTFFPRQFQKSCQLISKLIAGKVNKPLVKSTFSLDEKVELAAANLKAIGLEEPFAPFVVLCGHKSESSNNPYASALDCGACGGNSGGYSAKFAAEVFNNKSVRAGLRSKGIDLPDETIFVAAEHNTATDTFEFLNTDVIPKEMHRLFEQITADLQAAGDLCRRERQVSLPVSAISKFNEPSVRASDWAQVAPEWGLAGNAAFIAAPRQLTKGLNLKGRTFLHSYDYSKDPDGKILELILTAPLVVAQWINMQYYLSTVDNDTFGSGSKVIHNVVGDFGVMQGEFSDLQLGLPMQSVMATDSLRQHEPMRLLAIIRTNRTNIDRILKSHEAVANLVKNRWIRLVALDPISGQFHQADDLYRWRLLSQSENESENESGIESQIKAKVAT
ncbi:DUF2309 domain-containing protein [soil metagenome]